MMEDMLALMERWGMSSRVLVVRLNIADSNVPSSSDELLHYYVTDPLFYLHHANMDRIWWNWQAKSLATRLSDISGPTTFEGATQVTLAFGLLISTIGETLPIKSVMDIRASPMCYTYS